MTSYYLRKGIELGKSLAFGCFIQWNGLAVRKVRKSWKKRKRADALPFRMEPLFCVEDQKMMIHNAVLLDRKDISLTPGKYTCTGMCDSLLGRTNLDLEGNVYACCMNTLQKVGNLLK